MLGWNKVTRKGQGGVIVSEGYKTTLPHWGEVSIHPHIHYPGELFLECHDLGINMHPLGKIDLVDAPNPAETVLAQILEQHKVWCVEALAAIVDTENVSPSDAPAPEVDAQPQADP